MQTFLPYRDFEKSAQALDVKRLGKQRLEAQQIIAVLEGRSTAWKNHPAVKMWEGHLNCLKLYYNTIIVEWESRGYRNSMPLQAAHIAGATMPWWLGLKAFHSSHRAVLLYKEISRGEKPWYVNMGWIEEPAPTVWWPRREKR